MAATLQRKCSGGVIFVITTKMITKAIVPRNYFVIVSARMVPHIHFRKRMTASSFSDVISESFCVAFVVLWAVTAYDLRTLWGALLDRVASKLLLNWAQQVLCRELNCRSLSDGVYPQFACFWKGVVRNLDFHP